MKTGWTLISIDSKKVFDPTRIAEAIRNAGFSVGQVELTLRGKIEKYNGFFALNVSGLKQQRVVLKGGKKFEELKAAASVGKELENTGFLHPSHADRPPGITVEDFKLSDN
ncbi:hypothetical protein L0222_12775 [bacterium]|nr:hypothetical protein [bacterium]